MFYQHHRLTDSYTAPLSADSNFIARTLNPNAAQFKGPSGGQTFLNDFAFASASD